MARNKHPSIKKRLNKAGRQTRWAPFWTVPKKYRKGRRIHPGRLTHIKRSWRRTKIKV
ncbi:MAG TPA: 50S ribosomal protein L39e [Candidatus Nanoarchaeia archaeon]|nr:50S ribosomal protein L39e [Candidatus Nanoarchaeia archaeon]